MKRLIAVFSATLGIFIIIGCAKSESKRDQHDSATHRHETKSASKHSTTKKKQKPAAPKQEEKEETKSAQSGTEKKEEKPAQ